jgi:hypothetical protein
MMQKVHEEKTSRKEMLVLLEKISLVVLIHYWNLLEKAKSKGARGRAIQSEGKGGSIAFTTTAG